jgi:hypothetical protein
MSPWNSCIGASAPPSWAMKRVCGSAPVKSELSPRRATYSPPIGAGYTSTRKMGLQREYDGVTPLRMSLARSFSPLGRNGTTATNSAHVATLRHPTPP